VTLNDRIEAFAQLGRIIGRFLESDAFQEKPVSEYNDSDPGNQTAQYRNFLENAIKEAGSLYHWFSRQNILTALSGIVNV
jgi:hypothetical protein